MNQFLIESTLGLLCGLFLGITGIPHTGLVLLALEFFKIGDYKTNLGTIIFLNLFPITIGSSYEFYKENQINYSLGIILLLTIILGSFIGSKIVVGKDSALSIQNIKYITSALGFFIGISFLISAYYHKN